MKLKHKLIFASLFVLAVAQFIGMYLHGDYLMYTFILALISVVAYIG